MDPKALFNISYGLYVLSTRDNSGADAGCIINTVMQVTEAPSRLVIAINKVTCTHDMVLEAGRFNLSLLDQSTTFETIKHFGFQTSRDVDKFKTTDLPLEVTGNVYRLGASCNSYIQCKTASVVDLGTHSLIVADILDAQFIGDKPSLTYQYYQDHVKPKRAPTTTSKKTVWHCEVCGFEIEADSLPDDYICPLCGHGIDAFIKLEPKHKTKVIWHCDVCDFEIEADTLADDYICPVCKHGIDAFSRHVVDFDQPLSTVGREHEIPKASSSNDAKSGSEKKTKIIWHCEVCGYEIEIDVLPDDFICPVCKHGVDVFTKHVVDIDQPLSTVGRKNEAPKTSSNAKPASDNKTKTIWHCEVCRYEIEADSLADDFICPVCKRGIDVFTKHVVDIDQPLSTVGRKKAVSKNPSSTKLVADDQTETKSDSEKKTKIIWHCEVCRYEIEMDTLPDDFICPVCKRGIDVFTKHVVDIDQPLSTVGRKKLAPKADVKTDAVADVKTDVVAKGKTTWRCEVCGFEIEAESLPDDYICPRCGAGIEAFKKLD